jgi:hypothetical protein
LPVNVGVGQQLAFTLGFSPTSQGTFSDYLDLDGFLFNLSGSTPSSTLAILSPSANQNFTLSEANDTATMPIAFTANGTTDTVSWTATLVYQTSGGFPNTPYQLTRTFQTTANGQDNETYASQGGQVTVNASDDTTAEQASPISFAVIGIRIPGSGITTRLADLYSNVGGATHALMTGVAQVESSYFQFKRRSLYGEVASWPQESYDGGSHIGLMQMPTSTEIDYAWDWQVNTAAGVNLFTSKLSTAQRKMNVIIQQHPGLSALNAVELEHMALVLYGPYASPNNMKQYYVPVLSKHRWKWVVNTTGNPKGVAYADSCLSAVHTQ